MSTKMRTYPLPFRRETITPESTRAMGIFSQADMRAHEARQDELEGNGRVLSILTQAQAARAREINDIRRRIIQFLPVMSDNDRNSLLRSLGSDPDILHAAALATARQQIAMENRNLGNRHTPNHTQNIPTVTATGSDITYKEVAELYKLVEMIKDRVLTIGQPNGLELAEGVTLKDLASFTNSVNNLYGTFMKCKDMAKLHEDINKITEALKQAMKEMPQEYVNKFMSILSSFDD